MADEGTRGRDTEMDLFSGAKSLEGLLSDDLFIEADEDGESESDEESQSSDESEEDEEESDSDEDDESEEEEDEDESDEEDEEEDESEEDEVDEDADEETDDDSDEPQTYTVKVAGDEVEVTLDELKAGYSRTQDYTQKSMALAEGRRELQSDVQALGEVRARYDESLAIVERVLQVDEPDWEQLRKDQPEQYEQMRAAFAERKEQIEAVRAERTQMVQEAQEAEEQARAETLSGQADLLLAKIPAWVDEDVAKAEKARMLEHAMTAYGYEPEELDIVDHRHVLALRDAMRFHELNTKGEEVKDKVRRKRRKRTTLKPGTPKTGKSKKSKSSAARARKLAQTGHIKDGAAAIEDIIDY